MAWLPKGKVLVPVDFSKESLAAVDTALELAKAASGVHVLHVLPIMEILEEGIVWMQYDNDARRNHTTQALRERLSAPKYADIKFDVAFGNPGQEIALFAEQLPADVIVMPSHGRTGITRVLIGSVAERVVRLAHCPVLVLRS